MYIQEFSDEELRLKLLNTVAIPNHKADLNQMSNSDSRGKLEKDFDEVTTHFEDKFYLTYIHTQLLERNYFTYHAYQLNDRLLK